MKNSHALRLLTAAVLAVFGLSLSYGFLIDWDDGAFLHLNPRLDLTLENLLFYLKEPFQDLYTPLPFWSMMLDHHFFGLNALAFRIHGLLLYVAVTLLLFSLIRKAGADVKYAFAGTLLWAIHPQRVESVVWIVERKDLLCAFFAFLSLLLFLHELKRDRMPLLAALAAGLSFFCKPASAALPGIMVLWAIGIYGKRKNLREYLHLLALPVLIQAAFLIFAMTRTSITNPGHWETDWSIPPVNALRYLSGAVFPASPDPFYPPGWRWTEQGSAILLGLLILAAGIGYLVKHPDKRKNGFLFMLCWGGTVFPVLGIWHYTDFDFCDRYNLLPSAVLAFGAAFLLEQRNPPRKWRILLLTCFSAVYVQHTFPYLPVWKDTASLIRYTLARNERICLSAAAGGAFVGFRNHDVELMKAVEEKMRKNYPDLLNMGRTMNDLQCATAFLRGHIAFEEGRPRDGVREMFAAWGYFQMENGRFLWPELGKQFCFNMARACRTAGRDREADLLEQRLKEYRQSEKNGRKIPVLP